MHWIKIKRRTLLIMGGIFAGLFVASINPAQGALSRAGQVPSSSVEQATLTNIYLPLTIMKYPRIASPFGVEMGNLDTTEKMDMARSANVYWVRNAPISWNLIEPVRTNPPTYNWSAAEEQGLIELSQRDLHIIATVRFTPNWAQKTPGSTCGPIREDALPAFGEFLQATVARFSQGPYNVKYWELGNEPDVHVTDQSIPFGCWGDENDDYFGGGYYAKMLKVAYPAIKAADPQAKVLIGGLLLDCDPENPPEGKDCKPARFFEGILRYGGGDFFDIVSFHGYPPYDGNIPYDEIFPSWNVRGGVVLGKIDFLRATMTNFNLDKPIMHTEGGLLCPENSTVYNCSSPGVDFFEAQADYVVWLFVRNWATGVSATVWYPFEGPGWRNGGLLDQNQMPRPAYSAFKFLTEELAEAEYSFQLGQYPELRGYEFRAPGKRIWVMWSPDGQARSINLPDGILTIYDKYGNTITASGNQLNVKSPVFLELVP